MAENIGAVYPEGKWHKDNSSERFEHIRAILELYYTQDTDKLRLDDQDIRWFLKPAIVNNIYISEEVHKLGNRAWKFDKSNRMKTILGNIMDKGYVEGDCMDIRKFCNGKLVRFEHILPSNIYLDKLKEEYKNGKLTYECYDKIRSKVNICIVTVKEEKRLDKFRSTMPEGTDWLNNEGDEFARYSRIDRPIKIYKIKTKNQSIKS